MPPIFPLNLDTGTVKIACFYSNRIIHPPTDARFFDCPIIGDISADYKNTLHNPCEGCDRGVAKYNRIRFEIGRSDGTYIYVHW